MKQENHSKYSSARDKRNRRRKTTKYIAKQGVVFPDPLPQGQSVLGAVGEGAMAASSTGNLGIMAGTALFSGAKQFMDNKDAKGFNDTLAMKKDNYEKFGNKAVDPNLQMSQAGTSLAVDGMNNPSTASRKKDVEMQIYEVHAEKDPRDGRWRPIEIGKTPHAKDGSNDGGDDIKLGPGEAVIPSKNEEEKQQILALMEKGDAASTAEIDRIVSQVPIAPDKAVNGAFMPPNKGGITQNLLGSVYSSLYGKDDEAQVEAQEGSLQQNTNPIAIKDDINQGLYGSGDGVFRNGEKKTLGNYPDLSDIPNLTGGFNQPEVNPSASMVAPNSVNQGTNSQSTLRTGMTSNSKYASGGGEITEGQMADPNQPATYTQSMELIGEKLRDVDNTMPDGDLMSGLDDRPVEGAGIKQNYGKYANVAYNFMRGMEKPEVVKPELIELEKRKYTDNTQKSRADALRAKKSEDLQANDYRGSRGQKISHANQNSARYMGRQDAINTGAVDQKLAIEAENVGIENKERYMNNQEMKRVGGINRDEVKQNELYTAASIKEGSDIASRNEEASYIASRDAKLDQRNAILDSLVGTSMFKLGADGETMEFTGGAAYQKAQADKKARELEKTRRKSKFGGNTSVDK